MSLSTYRRAARRSGLLLVLLAMASLATVSSVANADDPRVTGFEAFVATPYPPVPTTPYAFALNATYDKGMPGWVRGSIFEETGGTETLLTNGCWYYNCVVNVPADPPQDMAHPRSRVFRIVLYSYGVPYEERTLVVNQRRMHFNVTVDFSQRGWAVTHIDHTLGNTDLRTIVRNESGMVASCNVYWGHCNAQISAGHTYHATVEDPGGNLFGSSSSWTVTSSGIVDEGLDGVDLVGLAGLFRSATDVCNSLLSYPGTHQAGSSASDQWLACDAAATSGSTLPQLLRAVATAGAGGTAVLWWLAHQGTISTLPPPPLGWPESAAPTAPLPAVWPVERVADDYMVQSNTLSQAQADTIAKSCLWLAARADRNGGSECASLPIFVTGVDVSEATQHDLEAIAAVPVWAKLNYEAAGSKSNRDWYRSEPSCLEPHDPDEQCDEFPFFATEQGGPLAVPTPSLRYIDADDNQYQGSLYGAFVTSCGLTTGTPQGSGNAVGGSPFLLVPVPPSLGVPTTRLCNRP